MTENPLKKLQLPATGLFISAGLNLFFGVLTTLSGLMRLLNGFGAETAGMSGAEKSGFYAATFVGYGAGVLSIIFAPAIFYGALKMTRGENLKWSRAAAILSVLPLACCSPLTAVFGIWALVTLGKPDVKAIFQNAADGRNLPPLPPQSR